MFQTVGYVVFAVVLVDKTGHTTNYGFNTLHLPIGGVTEIL